MSSSHIQAVVLSKEFYSKKGSEKFIKKNNFHPIKKMHETINLYRYRIREPDYDKYFYRIKAIKQGVKFIIGYPYEYYYED